MVHMYHKDTHRPLLTRQPALALLRDVVRDIERPTRELAEAVVKTAALAMREATGAGEVRDIRDRLRACEVYVRQQRADLHSGNLIAAQRIRTEWTLGSWLKENVEHQGGDATTLRGRHGALPLGVSEWHSRTWQRLAEVSESELEAQLTVHLDDEEHEITTAAVLRWLRTEDHALAHDEALASEAPSSVEMGPYLVTLLRDVGQVVVQRRDRGSRGLTIECRDLTGPAWDLLTEAHELGTKGVP